MRKHSFAGIALLGLGILFLIFGAIKFESHEEVFRVANLRATTTTEKTIPALRYVGLALAAAGAVVLLARLRR